MVRNPNSLERHALLREKVWANVDDVTSLTDACSGADAVISTLGSAPKGPTTVCTDGIRSAVTAMKQVRLSRLIAVSAHGVAETHDRSLYSLAVWASVSDRLRDKETMELLIRDSDLAWTIVRPPALKNQPETGTYRVGANIPIRLFSSISRADLAAFLILEAEQPRFVHGFPRIVR